MNIKSFTPIIWGIGAYVVLRLFIYLANKESKRMKESLANKKKYGNYNERLRDKLETELKY